MISEVKWSEVTWSEVKWGEDQLNAVKGRGLRWGGMWSVCKGSDVEWSVGLGEVSVRVVRWSEVWVLVKCVKLPTA
jgi:hypothetical protein